MLTSILGLFKLFNISKVITPLFPLMNKYWKLVVFLLLSSIIWYQNFWTGPEIVFGLDTIPNKNEDILTITKKLNESEQYNKKLEEAINETNKIIDEWKKATEQAEKERNELRKKLEQSKKESNAEIEKTMKDAVPKTCEEAFDYLRKGINDLKW